MARSGKLRTEVLKSWMACALRPARGWPLGAAPGAGEACRERPTPGLGLAWAKGSQAHRRGPIDAGINALLGAPLLFISAPVNLSASSTPKFCELAREVMTNQIGAITPVPSTCHRGCPICSEATTVLTLITLSSPSCIIIVSLHCIRVSQQISTRDSIGHKISEMRPHVEELAIVRRRASAARASPPPGYSTRPQLSRGRS